jgi:Tfp pilus assembly pilus retraction ATPase PilT
LGRGGFFFSFFFFSSFPADSWHGITAAESPFRMQTVQPHSRLGDMLRWCERRNASDLHVQAGKPLVIRVEGKLQRIPENTYNPLSDDEIYRLLGENFLTEVCERIRLEREVDLSFYHGYQRYRANFSKQKGSQSF